MDISINGFNQSFNARFVNNQAFRDVVNYAEKSGKLQVLENALHNIEMANSGDIMLIHGKNGENVFSSFKMGSHSSYNFALGEKSPSKVSLSGILELGKLGDKFRKLVGGNISYKATADDIIKKYTTAVNI